VGLEGVVHSLPSAFSASTPGCGLDFDYCHSKGRARDVICLHINADPPKVNGSLSLFTLLVSMPVDANVARKEAASGYSPSYPLHGGGASEPMISHR
jgi:hypothetical protein